jgi:hypothetical protein
MTGGLETGYYSSVGTSLVTETPLYDHSLIVQSFEGSLNQASAQDPAPALFTTPSEYTAPEPAADMQASKSNNQDSATQPPSKPQPAASQQGTSRPSFGTAEQAYNASVVAITNNTADYTAFALRVEKNVEAYRARFGQDSNDPAGRYVVQQLQAQGITDPDDLRAATKYFMTSQINSYQAAQTNTPRQDKPFALPHRGDQIPTDKKAAIDKIITESAAIVKSQGAFAAELASTSQFGRDYGVFKDSKAAQSLGKSGLSVTVPNSGFTPIQDEQSLTAALRQAATLNTADNSEQAKMQGENTTNTTKQIVAKRAKAASNAFKSDQPASKENAIAFAYKYAEENEMPENTIKDLMSFLNTNITKPTVDKNKLNLLYNNFIKELKQRG